jgi:dolichyl-phosphate beta-glucosyltransferase
VNIDLTLVIPAYNESSRLERGFERLAPSITQLGQEHVQVIIVDDGSSDNTLERARDVYGHLEHTQFIQQPTNVGKGAALRVGMLLARGHHVVTLDADMAIDPGQLGLIVDALGECEVAPGSRAVNGRIIYEDGRRTIEGTLFHRLVRHYTGTALRDTQCGCKGFRRGPAQILALLSMVDGFAFDVEVLYLAEQLGLATQPVHVTWQDVKGSSVRPLHDAWSMVRDIRGIRRTRYENPAVELSRSIGVDDLAPVLRRARLHSGVLALGEGTNLLVVDRNGAPGALGVASELRGTLRTTRINELRGRRFMAI